VKKSGEHIPLFPDEETIAIEIMGARRAKDWPEKARYLEDKHGLPRIDELMGGRFWPAVVEFFRVRHGMGLRKRLDAEEGDVPSLKQSPSIRIAPFKADGKEQYDGPETSSSNDRRRRGRDHR
jgi:hypothetical protein